MRIIPACLISVDLPPIFGPVINTHLALASSILSFYKNDKTSNFCVPKRTRKFVTFFCGNKLIGCFIDIKDRKQQDPTEFQTWDIFARTKKQKKLKFLLKNTSISHWYSVICQKKWKSTARDINHVSM